MVEGEVLCPACKQSGEDRGALTWHKDSCGRCPVTNWYTPAQREAMAERIRKAKEELLKQSQKEVTSLNQKA